MEFRYLHVSTQFKLIIYTLFLLIHSSIQESAQSAPNIPRYSFKEYSYVALPKYVSFILFT